MFKSRDNSEDMKEAKGNKYCNKSKKIKITKILTVRGTTVPHLLENIDFQKKKIEAEVIFHLTKRFTVSLCNMKKVLFN